MRAINSISTSTRHIKQTRCFLLFRIPPGRSHEAAIISQFDEGYEYSKRGNSRIGGDALVLSFCQRDHYHLATNLSIDSRERNARGELEDRQCWKCLKPETVGTDDAAYLALLLAPEAGFRKSLINDGSGSAIMTFHGARLSSDVTESYAAYYLGTRDTRRHAPIHLGGYIAPVRPPFPSPSRALC